MVMCMAEQCARLRTVEEQRSFAAQVARVTRVANTGLQAAFRENVTRLIARRKGSK